MLVFLSVDGLKVAFFCTSFLQVELLLELKVTDVRIHFDDIVPEDLLLIEGLLDFSNAEI